MKARTIYSSEPALRWLPWGALTPFLALLFVVGTAIPASLVLEPLGLVDHEQWNPLGTAGWFAFLLLPFGAMALVTLLWVRFVERRPFATIGLARPGSALDYVRGLAIGGITLLGVVLGGWALGGFRAVGAWDAFSSLRDLGVITGLLACFCVQAGAEELVFRGWMLSAVTRKFNLAWGVGLSSFVFCLLHYERGQAPLVTFNLVLFALFACAWALRSNRIWGVMGWHAGWNWLLATGFHLPVTGLDVPVPALLVHLVPSGSDVLNGGHQGPEGSIACTVFFGVAIAWLVFRGALRTSSERRR
jgi:membrane protease YdiL (CAAX protease family)